MNATKNDFEKSVEFFFNELSNFKTNLNGDTNFDFDKYNEFRKIFDKITNQVEQNKHNDVEESRLKKLFKEKFYPFAVESNFLKRAHDWPKGYPGDHITLEYLYKGSNESESVFGQYLDLYGMSRELGIGVRERKDFLRQLIEKHIFKGNFQSVLNIGCGSCRELYDMGLKLNNFEGDITCVDFDADALDFSKKTLASRSIKLENMDFKKMNVLQLKDTEFMKNELGSFDLIYSAGLFDYIDDKGLDRIFKSLHSNLNNNGVIIAPFKDANFYKFFDYHWFVNWDAFLHRTKDEVNLLINNAISGCKLEIIPSNSKAINFFIISK